VSADRRSQHRAGSGNVCGVSRHRVVTALAGIFIVGAVLAAVFPIHLPFVEHTSAQLVVYVHGAGERSCGTPITAWRGADRRATLSVTNIATGDTRLTPVLVSTCRNRARHRLLWSSALLVAGLAL